MQDATAVSSGEVLRGQLKLDGGAEHRGTRAGALDRVLMRIKRAAPPGGSRIQL